MNRESTLPGEITCKYNWGFGENGEWSITSITSVPERHPDIFRSCDSSINFIV